MFSPPEMPDVMNSYYKVIILGKDCKDYSLSNILV